MKLWVDRVNDPPRGYHWAGSVDMAIQFITEEEAMYNLWHRNPHDAVEEISISCEIEDRQTLIDWLQETQRPYNVMVHDNNCVSQNNQTTIMVSDEWTFSITKIAN